MKFTCQKVIISLSKYASFVAKFFLLSRFPLAEFSFLTAKEAFVATSGFKRRSLMVDCVREPCNVSLAHMDGHNRGASEGVSELLVKSFHSEQEEKHTIIKKLDKELFLFRRRD